jgi:hypothetical protein
LVIMLVLVVLIVAMIAAWTFALWPKPRATRDSPAPQAVPPTTETTAPAATMETTPVRRLPRAESTEGLLVAQLIQGDLTRHQYQKAMACLAERDRTRHPLSLPEEA